MNPSVSPHQVLVVEDDPSLVLIIEQVLKSIQPAVKIHSVTSAEEAMYELKRRRITLQESAAKTSTQLRSSAPFDLIIADIFLEGTSTGIDLWKLCQREFPETPLVVTSGVPEKEVRASLTAEGIRNGNALLPPFIQKPFSLRECRNSIQGLLGCAMP